MTKALPKTPCTPSPSPARSGVALVVTLGILAMICVTVIAFIASMRLERATARLESDRVALRSLHHVGLAAAMQDVTIQLMGRVYAFSPVASNSCLGSYYQETNTQLFAADPIKLFVGAATNLVPNAVHADAESAESLWIPVVSTIDGDGSPEPSSDPLAPLMDNVVLNRIAYLVIDCSGFLPPPLFNTVGYAAQTQLRDLPPEERDFTFYLAHDPDPEQYFAVRPEFKDVLTNAYPGLYATLVTNKFDVNSWADWTNDFPAAANEGVPLAYDPGNMPHVAGAALQTWVNDVAVNLYEIGFTNHTHNNLKQAEKMAWNLLNLLDEDRVPQYRRLNGGVEPTAAQPPSRATYAFENLPMINEVVVSNTAAADKSPAYSVAVELWYPFEPEQSPEDLVLSVGIYTNPAALPGLSAPHGPGDALGSFGFTNVVPLLYGPGRQFHVARSPKDVKFAPEGEELVSPPIGLEHPLYIWPRLYLACTNATSTDKTYVCVDEALLTVANGRYNFDNLDNVDIIVNDEITGIHEWTKTGSWQARNPFFNLLAQWGELNLGSPPPSTLWARNSNLDSGFEYPRFHLNLPMQSAGELGYLSLAQVDAGTVAFTNAPGAALLDRFTVFPTNRLEKASASRIQPNSPYPEVIASYFSAPAFSRPISDSDMPPLDTLTNAWFLARDAQEEGNSWNTFAELLPAFAAGLTNAWTGLAADDPAIQRDERKLPEDLIIEDVLRGLADQATFRQNIYVVIIAAQRLSPLGRVTADQRVAVTVVRDAYSGRWAIHDWRPLSE